MIAVFSLPLFAAWALSDNRRALANSSIPPRLDLIAAFLMGIMVFLRQRHCSIAN